MIKPTNRCLSDRQREALNTRLRLRFWLHISDFSNWCACAATTFHLWAIRRSAACVEYDPIEAADDEVPF